MHASENTPDENEHNHIQIDEEPHDDDDDLAICTGNNVSEESSDLAKMEVQPSEQNNIPTPMVPAFYDPTAQSYTVDVTDAASIASESNCDPRDTPTHLHTDFWRWLHAPTVEAGSSEAVADGEVSSGSSFDEAMDDTMALQPKSSSTEEDFGNLFTFANGGIFAGRD